MTFWFSVALCIGTLFGLITQKLFTTSVYWVVLVLIIGLIIFSLALVLQKQHLIRLAGLMIGTALGCALWYNHTPPNQFEELFDKNIYFTGMIVSRPSYSRSGNQILEIQPDNFTQLIRISLYHHIVAKGGERVVVSGLLERPKNFEDFNYVAYLKTRQVYAELKRSRVVIYRTNEKTLKSYLTQLRSKLLFRAKRLFEPNSAAIVLGILIGQKEQLPQVVEDSFRKVGLVHILVVSGFNLTIIASGFGVFARWFGRRRSDLLAIVAIWLFCLLVGASAAVIRAAIMSSLVIIGRSLGRFSGALFSLLLAATLMSLLNPWQLFYDVGFQLSVAATFGVITAGRLANNLQNRGMLAEVLWPSVGAIICTSPLIAYYFGTFSTVSVLANLIVLPIIPYLMLSGALSFVPVISTIFVPITESLVSAQLKVATSLAALPFSQLIVSYDLTALLVSLLIILIGSNLGLSLLQNNLKQSPSRAKIIKIIV